MNKRIFLLLALSGGLALAQLNPPPPKLKAASQPPTEISSDSADFDLNIRRAIYRGHVLVVDPKVTMQCELLVVDLPAAGGHLTNVLAQTDVVIDFIDERGKTNHVTAAKAVYAYSLIGSVTNETVTFTGTPGEKPRVEYPDYTITSEPLIWDRAGNHFIFHDEKMIFRQNISGGGTSNAASGNFFLNGIR
jgi:lipopolysaccharide export system protein LptA